MFIQIILNDPPGWKLWSRGFNPSNAELLETKPATREEIANVHQPKLVAAHRKSLPRTGTRDYRLCAHLYYAFLL